MFVREDWTLFRQLATLSQKAGVPTEKVPALVAKELADNALDVVGTESCLANLLQGENGFFVEDKGPGFDGDDDQVAFDVLDQPTAHFEQTPEIADPWGALGNGLRVVAGSVLASGGSLVVETRGRILQLAPRDSGETTALRLGDSDRAGTRVEVRLGSSLPVSRDTLDWVRTAFHLSERGETYRGKTSPHWYDSDAFHELLQSAVGRSVADVIGSFEGCAQPKAGRIARAFAGRMATSMSREESDRVMLLARQESRPVAGKRLGFVGGDVREFPANHARVVGSLKIDAARGKFSAELPYVVEAWADIAREASIGVSVNRTPISAEVTMDYRSGGQVAIFGGGLKHGFAVGRRAVRIHLNLDIPYMPILSDGKAPDLLKFHKPIAEVIGKAVRKAKTVAGFKSVGNKLPTSQKDVILECLDEAVEKAGEGGKYRFSLRQLFYAVRPHVIEKLGKEPDYDYFGKVIGQHESEQGADIPGIYRDARGTLYHPHTGEEIALGTLAVEGYERPAWTFNKILYSEKEGFFQILKSASWPERNDCALMTSKGFASRAARDVLDLLGETGEDLTFFCIHDADASGTMIFQSLQGATQARAARKVNIVNLGLEPAEALAMGLQVEAVERKGDKAATVADYVPGDWAEWLQTKRVELNAMTSPQFLEWLDRKFADAGGKVVPPVEVLTDRLEAEVRENLNREIARKILDDADLDGQVNAAFEDCRPMISGRLATLADDVKDDLEIEPANNWREPVRQVAAEIASEAVEV